MENNYPLSSVLDHLLKKQLAFACWFNPKDNRLGIVVGNASDVKLLDRFDQLNGEAGFVFAPYRITEKSPVILLKPSIYLEDFNSADQINLNHIKPFSPVTASNDHCSTRSKEEYIQTIDETIATIRKSELSKVIISRQIPVKRTTQSLGNTFFQLHDQTPNAFTYLVNLPAAGTWMGATPEVLLKSDEDYFETVSLAGTQVRKYDSEDYYWNTKDIEEQAFVSRYMLELFYSFGIHKYRTTGPETLESGKVAHLKTSFFFPVEKIDSCLGNFVAELHPTPAVCGLPKKLADELIREKEKHDRKYYTGYLGPWKLNQQVNLFVNLRCMEITNDEYILYAGGGITSKSIPEREWEETNQKATTLLAVINTQNYDFR
ncbi:MAG TPA: isochorismate synthase [Prolixibacteraceae bacterium]|jgi:isochorismate synthase|nr:isochorismate synthase [Prolixibacteraceae bacterium]